MPLPVQAIFPGVLGKAYRRELQNLVVQNAVPRLWAKDISLWPVEEHQAESVKSNLGWLDLPERLGPMMTRVTARAAEIESAGFEDIVFIAIDGANLAAEATLRLLAPKLGKRSFLLDSIDPDSIHALEVELRLDRTLFIFASKSGKNIETHTLLLYFLQKLKSLSVSSPGRHFVALSEEDSYLAELAAQYNFLDVFFEPPGVISRYSSLIHFNFFLSALCQFERNTLLSRAQSMRDACGPSAPEPINPALALGAFLAAGEIAGLDRLVFFSTESLEPLTCRIGHLVGASTGKRRHGIIPISGHLPDGLEMLRRGCVVAILKMACEEQRELNKKCDELRGAGVPVVSIELNGPEDLGVELFKWEVATALTCVLLHVNPFDDPDFRDGRAKTVQILEQATTKQEFPSPTIRVREGDIELCVEGETRQQISTLNMTEALRTFFSLRNQDGYLALLPFVGRSTKLKTILRRIRDQLVCMLELPVLVTSGPRYLHGHGQAYKGGPAKGLFLLLTADPAKDIAVPGAGYSFGQLQLALALGDFESLGRNLRPVIRLHLACGAEQGLIQLESALTKALGKNPIVAA